jgi:hypothetical protein
MPCEFNQEDRCIAEVEIPDFTCSFNIDGVCNAQESDLMTEEEYDASCRGDRQ